MLFSYNLLLAHSTASSQPLNAITGHNLCLRRLPKTWHFGMLAVFTQFEQMMSQMLLSYFVSLDHIGSNLADFQ